MNEPISVSVKPAAGQLSAMRAKEGDEPENERQWKAVIESYGWSHCDDLDNAIFEGVVAGYFNEAKISEASKKAQNDLDNNKENNAFSRAWRLYHDSFVVDDDHVLEALYEGAKESMRAISPLSLNSTTLLMREFGRSEQADELIGLYMAQSQLNANRLDQELTMWGAETVDPALSAAFECAKAGLVDTRNARDVLIAMVTNRGWDEADMVLLGKQTPDDFEKIFESIEGQILPSVVKYAVSLGGDDGENQKLVGRAATDALRRIAAKSPMRKRRVASYGVTTDE